MNIKSEIINSFKTGTAITKLIYINLAIFLLVNLVHILLKLTNTDGSLLTTYLALPANLSTLISRPWTLISYMFMHEDFFHILFNVLNLYWFGKLFLMFFNQKQAIGLYILGGLTGAGFYLLTYNIFPYFEATVSYGYLLGASASVLAIVMGVATYSPNTELQMMFIGKVKLKYLAAVFFVLSLFSIAGNNAGGNIAHLGGILAGYLFALNIKKGKDFTKGINRAIDFFVDLFAHKPKMKVSHKTNRMTDAEWNANKAQAAKKLDSILDKIKKSGYNSLSTEEKKQLFDQSKRS